jgi:hypothetical protein
MFDWQLFGAVHAVLNINFDCDYVLDASVRKIQEPGFRNELCGRGIRTCPCVAHV